MQGGNRQSDTALKCRKCTAHLGSYSLAKWTNTALCVSSCAVQIPLVLTAPSKRGKGTKGATGCGCMIPAASKVLAKVSPSSRLGSSSSAGGSRDPSKALTTPGLEKPSPDRQRLIGQGFGSSDEQGSGPDLPSGLSSVSTGSGELAAGMDALHYFGVFDGHGGVDAARHCAQRMHQVRGVGLRGLG